MTKNALKLIKYTVIFVLCIAMLMLPQNLAAASSDHSNILRLHILANSNSDCDQGVKLVVRDAVLRFASGSFYRSENADISKKLILENGDALLCTVESTLESEGFDYGAQLRLGRYSFPDRQYADKFYPAGEYEALKIILGDGKGDNWWCVIFPPLCITEPSEGQIIQNGDNPEVKSLFADLFKWFSEVFS